MDKEDQIKFQAYVSVIWITYLIAIWKNPGTPPKNFNPKVGEWRRWCKKCENYKPERTHHCRSCNQCVLKMDHHCPWTNNCVGHENFPHFLRFVVSVVVTTGWLLIELFKRVVQYYEDRNLPSYLIDKREMFAVIFLLPIDLFVFATITILLGRCIINLIFKGMTQIEVWEKERIEQQFYSERMWAQIRQNYFKLYKKPLPELTSWNHDSRYYDELAQKEDELDELEETQTSFELHEHQLQQEEHNDNQESLVPKSFTMDDIVFPYDYGLWSNLIQACGYPWMWLMPLGGPRGNGYVFPPNEYVEEDQLGLPWPPDGGHQEISVINNQPDFDDLLTDDHTIRPQDLGPLRRRLDPRLNLSRKEWMNEMGETLNDFGVDVDAEAYDKEDIIPTN